MSNLQSEDSQLLPPEAEPSPLRGLLLGPLAMTSGILTPDDGDRVPAGPTDVIGYAFPAEGRRVVRVEVSVDGGGAWTQADVDDAPSPWAWQLWHITVDLPAGPAEITARAWDDSGATQPEFPASLWNPGGYADNSWPRVRVDAGWSAARPGEAPAGLGHSRDHGAGRRQWPGRSRTRWQGQG
jgi:sulfite oxidase